MLMTANPCVVILKTALCEPESLNITSKQSRDQTKSKNFYKSIGYKENKHTSVTVICLAVTPPESAFHLIQAKI